MFKNGHFQDISKRFIAEETAWWFYSQKIIRTQPGCLIILGISSYSLAWLLLTFWATKPASQRNFSKSSRIRTWIASSTEPYESRISTMHIFRRIARNADEKWFRDIWLKSLAHKNGHFCHFLKSRLFSNNWYCSCYCTKQPWSGFRVVFFICFWDFEVLLQSRLFFGLL